MRMFLQSMTGILKNTPCNLGLVESGTKFFDTIVRVVSHTRIKYDAFLLQTDIPHNIPAEQLLEQQWLPQENRFDPTRRQFENAGGFTYVTEFDDLHRINLSDLGTESLFFPRNWLSGPVSSVSYKTVITKQNPVPLLRWNCVH